MLEEIWLTPPLAFARVGTSPKPCAAFGWGANDTRPRGTASTSLVPCETLSLSDDGIVSATVPLEIKFRDQHGIRPVCPFFELHGRWDDGTGTRVEGPLTRDLLQSWKIGPEAITWEVHLANLKAFHYTFQKDDRVDARITLSGAQTQRAPLRGVSPAGAAAPLALASAPVPLGAVQVSKLTAEFPEVRLRFFAPAGLVYGPADLGQRLAAANFDFEAAPGFQPNAEWRGFRLAAAQQVLNPEASWSRYLPERATLGPLGPRDYRNTPGGLLATLFETIDWLEDKPVLERSLGLLDDVSDGLISCTVDLQGRVLRAVARVVVGPPDFAPANRPPVSLADNLADREDRESPRRQAWSKEELGELVLDILERAFETSDLMNKDYQNFRSHRTNDSILIDQGTQSPFDSEDVRAMLWPRLSVDAVLAGRASALALSQEGTRKHRRNAAAEFLEDRFREAPQLFEQWLRRPLDPSPYFDRRMPALMRGSDGRPFHLTRRQWEIFRAWIAALRDTGAAALSAEDPR